MTLNDTPRGDRIHIGIFGRRNAGKSSLINALTGQELAIVSQTPGTTADPVFKAMELHPVGPVVFIDTAGFDDEGELGQLRVAKTAETIGQTDVAVLVLDGAELAGLAGLDFTELAGLDFADEGPEGRWIGRLREEEVPVIAVINKWDQLNEAGRAAVREMAGRILLEPEGRIRQESAGQAPKEPAGRIQQEAERRTQREPADRVALSPIPVSARTGEGIDALREVIAEAVPEGILRKQMTAGLIEDQGLALLVMPQNIQAPKGRLILPQVQTIRELLDRGCTVVSTTLDGLERSLQSLGRQPDLIITDSQCFREVYEKKPEGSRLTSFSILMAAAKGDIEVFVDGVSAIDDVLNNADVAQAAEALEAAKAAGSPFRVLIAEACTHVPQNEDIGTVKIPRLLKQKLGDRVEITGVRGKDFPDPEALKQYDLIIHCGACMFNRSLVTHRIRMAREAGVPMTNYGVFLAKMSGILDKVSLPGI